MTSLTGRAFATYLDGARGFYRGDYNAAGTSFTSLQGSRNAWLREAGLYMIARTALNAAQSTLFDDYGSILPVEKRDQRGIAAAGSAFQNYLRAYPHGRYAASATGLMRRVYWLAGDKTRLSGAYEDVMRRSGASSAPDDLRLVQWRWTTSSSTILTALTGQALCLA